MNKQKRAHLAHVARHYGNRAAVAVTSLALSGLAMAQTDPGVDAINQLSGKATSYTTAAFAVASLVAGAFWGISMMKKAFSKAK